ncbi:hypothetical protein [Actinomycetia phage DSL-LC01]|nr:hypothetical protein [Actinomycetia phage DSL-LC01]
MNLKVIEVDIAWDDSPNSGENLGTQLESLNKLIPNAWVKVLKYVGPGGGWPMIEIAFPEDKAEILAEWFGQEDDMEFFMENLRDFAI